MRHSLTEYLDLMVLAEITYLKIYLLCLPEHGTVLYKVGFPNSDSMLLAGWMVCTCNPGIQEVEAGILKLPS